jgi:outer membrane protein, heavy metal efflux system
MSSSLPKTPRLPVAVVLPLFLIVCLTLPAILYGAEETLSLSDLITEGLQKSPEILAAQARAEAAGFRISQAKSLPDPMFMFGYQNEGFQRLTIGKEIGAMGMFTVSQMFFFPGKRELKGEMAARDAESIAAMYNAARLKVASKIKEIYYDLFLAHKTIDILKDRTEIYSRMEDAATTRYSSGMGSQQEVVMAQTEKYMILEQEEMQRQKVQALQGMLNATVGRDVTTPLGRPALLTYTPFDIDVQQAIAVAEDHSPELASKRKMIEGAEAKVKMARKEYYPDVTIGASYFPRTQGMMDMWNLTATVNLPIFYKSKQRQAVLEAEAGVSAAKRELAATEYMIASSIRENYSMVRAADRLMKLYREGLVPKASQDVQLALSGYVAGKAEALTVITRIKNLLDYDVLYWNQFVGREKAIAKLHEFTGSDPTSQGSGGEAR